MKKLLALVLAMTMVLSLAACGAPAPAAPATDAPAADAPATDAPADGAAAPYKIAIITGTVSQGEEEFRAAEKMKAKYPDMIVTATYPDNFSKEQETTISNTLNLVSDEAVKALVFVQSVPGAAAAIAKAKEMKPDLLVISGTVGEDPGTIAPVADVVLNGDELGMGKTIMDQAKTMGAKTFVHYSFPRHMSVALIAGRHDLLKKYAEEYGITFVDATAPDPTGDSGIPGAQQFILEDVPKMIEKYGPDTAFFSTNCSMQEPLLKTVIAGKAISPQQCCPSPYHAYPGALGIAIPDDKAGDVPFILEETTKKITEMGNPGRMSTWTAPMNMMFVEAGVQYAQDFLDGKIKPQADGSKADLAAMKAICDELAGAPVSLTLLEENGVTYNNFFSMLGSYYTFGEVAA